MNNQLNDETFNEIFDESIDDIRRWFKNEYKNGTLENLLKISDLAPVLFRFENYFNRPKRKQIYVIIDGKYHLKDEEIYGLFKLKEIDKQQIIILRDYKKFTNYDFEKFKNKEKYAAIIVGSMPHSVKGKGDFDSIISRIEHEQEEWPILKKTCASNELKLTKSNLSTILETLFE